VALLSGLTICTVPCVTASAQPCLSNCNATLLGHLHEAYAQSACVQVFAQPPQTTDGGSRTGRDTCNRTALGHERSLGPLVRAEE